MATIVYLDAEDEITSAAARIRSAAEPRVGLVLPFGSRVATSRINFRLLAREAMNNERRLDIIAPDASARALAASAGLPVFGSVGEYEEALEHGGPALEATAAARAAAAEAAGGGAATAGGTGPARRTAGDTARMTAGPPHEGAPDATEEPGDLRDLPSVRPPRRLPGRAMVLAVIMLLVAAGAVAAAGYLLLPSAVITITPHIEAVGPISFTVHADPVATGADAEAGVIPAQTLTIPVESQAEFPATGRRVTRTAATGGVRWTNCDPTASYTIPSGTVVKTADGIGFSTDEQVFLPVATPTGTPGRFNCQTSEVAVTAVKPGPTGNVDAGAISVIPARYNRNVIEVTNPAATSGGTREVFQRVSQADVDAAVEQLTKDLDAQFASEVQNPARVPPGMTVYPDTATLSDPVPSVDPTTLVGQEVDSFTLRMTAQGTVVAVDPSPIVSIARDRLTGQVRDGYQLVNGSTRVDVGDGQVVAGEVTFPVTGSAKQRRPIDAVALEAEVLGLSETDAEARLAPYGDVTIELWPDWVHAVPSLTQRVTLTVNDAVDSTASPSASVSPSPSAAGPTSSADPTGGASAGEPVPSGG